MSEHTIYPLADGALCLTVQLPADFRESKSALCLTVVDVEGNVIGHLHTRLGPGPGKQVKVTVAKSDQTPSYSYKYLTLHPFKR